MAESEKNQPAPSPIQVKREPIQVRLQASVLLKGILNIVGSEWLAGSLLDLGAVIRIEQDSRERRVGVRLAKTLPQA